MTSCVADVVHTHRTMTPPPNCVPIARIVDFEGVRPPIVRGGLMYKTRYPKTAFFDLDSILLTHGIG